MFIKKGLWPEKDYFKMSSFHHDYLGIVQKTGLYKLTHVKKYTDRFYRATVVIKGKELLAYKTFFPKHWTQEKVIESIAEAYNNTKIIDLKNDGKCLIKGTTKTGIIIKMHITQKGKITSAYPFFD